MNGSVWRIRDSKAGLDTARCAVGPVRQRPAGRKLSAPGRGRGSPRGWPRKPPAGSMRRDSDPERAVLRPCRRNSRACQGCRASYCMAPTVGAEPLCVNARSAISPPRCRKQPDFVAVSRGDAPRSCRSFLRSSLHQEKMTMADLDFVKHDQGVSMPASLPEKPRPTSGEWRPRA